jgi:hypothetical protein
VAGQTGSNFLNALVKLMITVEGTVQRLGRGQGIWRLITRDGSSYELSKNAPHDLLKPDQRVMVKGHVEREHPTARDQAVLEVIGFELLPP